MGDREAGCAEVVWVYFLFLVVLFFLLRCESKYSCILLAVYILRGYRGRINENPLSKKYRFVKLGILNFKKSWIYGDVPKGPMVARELVLFFSNLRTKYYTIG